MTLLDKVGSLIRHTEQMQLRVTERLAQQRQNRRALQEAIEGLAVQGREIERLLESQKLANCVIDRAALFMLQQRQAVLRQQRYQLDFERDRLREETEALEQEQQKTRTEIQLLVRKQNKLGRLQREASEIEDSVGWLR
jgi:vacuolar-type H+-ATPase subunit I/STV1